MSLNANTPTVVGMEWFPVRERGLTVDPNRRYAAILTPGAIASDDIAVYLKNVSGSPVMNAEVIKTSDITTAAAGAATVDTFRPSADQGIFTGAAHAGGGTVAPFYVDFDEAVLDTTDYVKNASLITGEWGFNVASGGFASNRRILQVVVKWVHTTTAGTGQVQAFYNHSSTSYYGGVNSIGVSQSQPQTTFLTNPATGAPWTPADIVALASSDYFGIAWTVNGGFNTYRLYQAWIEVSWITETRLALGYATATADGWLTISMATPGGTDTWTPTAATQYAVVLSTSTSGGTATIAALDSGSAHPDVSSSPVTFTESYPTALGTTDTAVPALVALSGGAAVYGSPYALLTEEAVYTGRVLQQEVTLPDTASRGWFKFVCRQQSTATTASLLVKLKRRSDDVQVGGTLTVTPFDVRSNPRLPQVLTLPAVSGAAGTAAQHYVEFTSTATSGNGWLVTSASAEEAAAVQKLTTNQQGLETDTTGWVAGTNTGITRDTATKRTGAASLQFNRTAGGSGTAIATTTTGASGFVVGAGALVAASMWARDNGTNHRTIELRVGFYDSGGSLIGTASLVESKTSTGSFVQWSGTVIAPAGAVTGAVIVNALSTVSTENFYGDDFSVLVSGIYSPVGVGGNTDQATIAGTETTGRDIPVLVGTTRAAPASQAVTQT